MKTATSNSRKAVKKNGKSRYTHAIYYRADGTERRVNFQVAEAEAKPAAKAAKPAKPAKKAAKTVASKKR